MTQCCGECGRPLPGYGKRLLANGVELDFDAMTATKADGEQVRFGKQSWALLEALERGAPGPVSRDQLLREVWASEFYCGGNVSVTVCKLRRLLGEDSIRIVYRRGYALNLADDLVPA